MFIDEERTLVLTKYVTTKGKKSKIESDHNLLFARFAINYKKLKRSIKREIFNFKNIECQPKFFELTNSSSKLSEGFNDKPGDFIQQSNKFYKVLKSAFHQCFNKIRVTNKTTSFKPDELKKLFELKTKFKVFLNTAHSEISRQFTALKISEIESEIMQLTSDRNVKIINEQLGQINNLNGSVSQIGIWKVKSKLLPRPVDPPMAKRDTAGNNCI